MIADSIDPNTLNNPNNQSFTPDQTPKKSNDLNLSNISSSQNETKSYYMDTLMRSSEVNHRKLWANYNNQVATKQSQNDVAGLVDHY
jgi:hypothetical protein